MRPVSKSQDLLQHPLNVLFAAESRVRILRYLAQAQGPAGATEISHRTGVSAPGVRKALPKLVAAGAVAKEGTGRSFHYRLRRNTPLAEAVVELFEVESRRYQDLLQRLRDVADQAGPSAQSVWVQSSPEAPGEPMVVGVYHSPRDLGPYLRELRRRIGVVEQEFELTVELAGYTIADLADERPPFQTLLGGAPLPGERTPRPAASLERSDRGWGERAFDRAREVAAMIETDPTLIPKARRWIDRLLEQGRGMAEADLREWRGLLNTYSRSRLVQFVRSRTPRAERLRRSSPFLPVLTDQQRRELEERVP